MVQHSRQRASQNALPRGVPVRACGARVRCTALLHCLGGVDTTEVLPVGVVEMSRSSRVSGTTLDRLDNTYLLNP